VFNGVWLVSTWRRGARYHWHIFLSGLKWSQSFIGDAYGRRNHAWLPYNLSGIRFTRVMLRFWGCNGPCYRFDLVKLTEKASTTPPPIRPYSDAWSISNADRLETPYIYGAAFRKAIISVYTDQPAKLHIAEPNIAQGPTDGTEPPWLPPQPSNHTTETININPPGTRHETDPPTVFKTIIETQNPTNITIRITLKP